MSNLHIRKNKNKRNRNNNTKLVLVQQFRLWVWLEDVTHGCRSSVEADCLQAVLVNQWHTPHSCRSRTSHDISSQRRWMSLSDATAELQEGTLGNAPACFLLPSVFLVCFPQLALVNEGESSTARANRFLHSCIWEEALPYIYTRGNLVSGWWDIWEKKNIEGIWNVIIWRHRTKSSQADSVKHVSHFLSTGRLNRQKHWCQGESHLHFRETIQKYWKINLKVAFFPHLLVCVAHWPPFKYTSDESIHSKSSKVDFFYLFMCRLILITFDLIYLFI